MSARSNLIPFPLPPLFFLQAQSASGFRQATGTCWVGSWARRSSRQTAGGLLCPGRRTGCLESRSRASSLWGKTLGRIKPGISQENVVQAGFRLSKGSKGHGPEQGRQPLQPCHTQVRYVSDWCDLDGYGTAEHRKKKSEDRRRNAQRWGKETQNIRRRKQGAFGRQSYGPATVSLLCAS